MLYSNIRYYYHNFNSFIHIYCQIVSLVILYFYSNKYSIFYIHIFGFLGHSPWHFNIMILHAGLCHAESFMREWHTQSSISYELRHVSLPLRANGPACITHPMPCTHSSL